MGGVKGRIPVCLQHSEQGGDWLQESLGSRKGSKGRLEGHSRELGLYSQGSGKPLQVLK